MSGNTRSTRPCLPASAPVSTPPGSPHHYTFLIIGTDLEPKALPAGLTLPELQEKLNGHVKGAAGLVGLFVKPQ